MEVARTKREARAISVRNCASRPPKQQIERSLRRGLARARVEGRSRGGFDLDLDWCLQQAERQGFKCALTGIPFFLHLNMGLRNPYGPSMDRIDCGRGYTRDNVRIVIYGINFMLSHWGLGIAEHVMSAFLKQKGRLW